MVNSTIAHWCKTLIGFGLNVYEKITKDIMSHVRIGLYTPMCTYVTYLHETFQSIQIFNLNGATIGELYDKTDKYILTSVLEQRATGLQEDRIGTQVNK